MKWQDTYRDKLITPTQAAGLIKSGQRVLMGLGTLEPQYVANALCDRWQELRDVEILTSNTMKPYPWFEKEKSAAFKIHAGYLSAISRPLYQEKRLEYSINTVYSPAKWLEPGRTAPMMEADVCLLTLSPPNDQGFCSFGEQLWYSREWVKRSRVVIAEVNPLVIRTGGDNYVHVSQIDYLLADPHVTPTSEESHFTERIWRLPQTYLCFMPPNIALDVGPLPALSTGHITFGSFNNLAKMNDAVVAVWSHVLRAVPGSRLFLKTVQLNEEEFLAARKELDAEKEEERQLDQQSNGRGKDEVVRRDFYFNEVVSITVDYVNDLKARKIARAR